MSRRRQGPKTGLYYHYTSADVGHLGSILTEGVLRTAESNLSFETPHAGPDVVWMLANRYRQGEAHGLVNHLTGEFKTYVEIVVRLPKPEVAMWASWAKEKGMSDHDFAVLVHSGGGLTDALRWRIIEREIPRSEWVSITYTPTGETIPVTATKIPETVVADFIVRYDRAVA